MSFLLQSSQYTCQFNRAQTETFCHFKKKFIKYGHGELVERYCSGFQCYSVLLLAERIARLDLRTANVRIKLFPPHSISISSLLGSFQRSYSESNAVLSSSRYQRLQTARTVGSKLVGASQRFRLRNGTDSVHKTCFDFSMT